jgi:hypothetical protein
MMEIELPAVQGNVSVKEALKQCHAFRTGAAAILAAVPSGHVLYTAQALAKVVRTRGGNVAVSTIRGEETIAVPEGEPGTIRTILDQAGVAFGVLASQESSVRLMVRSDQQARDLSLSVSICTCPLNTDHVYLESDLGGDKTCEFDGAKLDCD